MLTRRSVQSYPKLGPYHDHYGLVALSNHLPRGFMQNAEKTSRNLAMEEAAGMKFSVS